MLIKVVIRIILCPFFIPTLVIVTAVDIMTGFVFELAVKLMDVWSLD